MLPLAPTLCSSGGIAIRNVLLVVSMTSWLYGTSCIFISGKTVTAETTASVPTNVAQRDYNISNYTAQIVHRGRKLVRTIASFVYVRVRRVTADLHVLAESFV